MGKRIYFKLAAFSAGFVALATVIGGALYWSEAVNRSALSGERDPASKSSSLAVFDEDGVEVYAHDRIEDLDDASTRRQGSSAQQKVLAFTPAGKHQDEYGSARTSAQLGTGIATRRARRVRWSADKIENARASGRVIVLNLFGDLNPQVRFHRPSVYGTNHALYSGAIEGDPQGRVEIMIGGGSMDATIETSGRLFRIVDAGRGLLYVIEVER